MAAAVPFKTWTAIAGSTLGAFMAILNIQIVNASLADIRGAIGAGVDDGAWIATAYLTAEIVAIPLAGWLARVFSTRRYLIASAALFLLFSVACAFAQNLGQMIVLRVLQGFSGGVLIPLSFTLIITLLPPNRQPVGMAMFAIAATLAPVIGPTIGGTLSESWGWQSIFYLNLVPGTAMLATLWFSLEREPMQLGLLRRGDWAGIITVAIGLGAAQTVLEEGEKHDWLDSPFIARLAIAAVLSLGLFVWIELTTAHPLVNLRLLGRRNFLGGALATFLLGLVSYGTVFILPTYLAQVQGYNAQQIGLVLAWTGLPQLLVIPLVPSLMRMVDARWLIVAGLGVFAASNFMNVAISTDLGGDQLLLPNVVRAVGQALVLTPLATLAVAGIEAGDKASASALLNVLRNLGGAFGIAALQTFLIRREHFHSSTLAQSVSLFDEATRQRIDQLVHYFRSHGVVDQATAWHKAVAAIAGRVHRQAYTLAFGDVFLVLGAILLVAILATLLLKKPARAAAL
jgi:DHA2 family multidrug resistance protein